MHIFKLDFGGVQPILDPRNAIIYKTMMPSAYLFDFHLFIQLRLSNMYINKLVSLTNIFVINHQNTPLTYNGGSRFFSWVVGSGRQEVVWGLEASCFFIAPDVIVFEYNAIKRFGIYGGRMEI